MKCLIKLTSFPGEKLLDFESRIKNFKIQYKDYVMFNDYLTSYSDCEKFFLGNDIKTIEPVRVTRKIMGQIIGVSYSTFVQPGGFLVNNSDKSLLIFNFRKRNKELGADGYDMLFFRIKR